MNRVVLAALTVLFVGCSICAGFAPRWRLTGLARNDPISHAFDSPTSVHSKHIPDPSSQIIDDGAGRFGSRFQHAISRLDTVKSARLMKVQTQGVSIKSVWNTAKKVWNPRTYLAVILLSGFRYKWCFNSVFYWLAVAFGVKWYRARYVYKIPVMDRQPNWNNVITSKDQEKDLKAYTCKTCGSTLFMAKSREFLFEGKTGIGGLGCFNCGASGKDNFVSDRDRIVEDVGDLDDYFSYERPLDFVSAAERRKVLKEAGGDEEKANQLLVERSAQGETNASSDASSVVDAEIVDPSPPAESRPPKTKPSRPSSPPKQTKTEDDVDDDDDILDILDMD
ncbi:hypothetical protein MPSEU_000488800 [Mayamaea pseudoterrestris]|nr:hypothetical protein MPSEU_000488800 [Mayamaea pseudoterrestris]